jgi:hypothetical protein
MVVYRSEIQDPGLKIQNIVFFESSIPDLEFTINGHRACRLSSASRGKAREYRRL